MANDYYLILGIHPQATTEEIKTAYRRQALELHPGLAGADSEPFLALQLAYSVLSDPARRREYDWRGRQSASPPPAARAESPTARRPEAEPFRAPQPAANLGTARLTEDFETYAPSLDEVFERIWSNYAPSAHRKGERERSLTVEFPITAEQAFHGGVVRLQVPALVPCAICGGHGSVGFFECLRCAGQGHLVSHYTVPVAFPAGLTSDYVAQIPLRRLGIRNLYLTVRFRVSEVMV